MVFDFRKKQNLKLPVVVDAKDVVPTDSYKCLVIIIWIHVYECIFNIILF